MDGTYLALVWYWGDMVAGGIRQNMWLKMPFNCSLSHGYIYVSIYAYLFTYTNTIIFSSLTIVSDLKGSLEITSTTLSPFYR